MASSTCRHSASEAEKSVGLPGGGHGMGMGDAGGTGRKPQLAAAGGDGPGRDQDEFPVLGAEAPDLPHQALDEGLVEAIGRSQDRAPQLEDHPLGLTQVVLSLWRLIHGRRLKILAR